MRGGPHRYETACAILQKLRAGMVRPERDTIGSEYPVEKDKCLVGGETPDEGRGVHHKEMAIGAVEVRKRKESEERTTRQKDAHRGGVAVRQKVYGGR